MRDLDTHNTCRGAPRKLRTQYLHGDFAVVLDVVRKVDSNHAAFAELAFDPSSFIESPAQEGDLGYGWRIALACNLWPVRCIW